METVVKIEDFKKRQRRRYLKTHNARIERFISLFIAKHAPTSFEDFIHQYQYVQRNEHQVSWDYLELRELIIESLEKSMGAHLAEELAKQRWYDKRWLSWERILELCLTELVAYSAAQESAKKS